MVYNVYMVFFCRGPPSNNALTSSSSPSVRHHHQGHSAADTSGVERHMDRVLSPSSWEDPFQRRESGTIGSGITNLGGGGQHMKPHHSLFDRDLFPGGGGGGGGGSGSGGGGGGGSENGISKVEVDDENYRILVDVRDFRPEELVIKTVGNAVHFEARHEEKTADGHSYTSRNVSQSFTLPRGVDPEAVTSSLSKEGTLTISAPLPPALKLQSNERLVPIKHR